ncbi:MAG TPA: selenium-dependent xanthine dehydrogenase [Thermoanaerobaculia bacterium]|nr:selenium-dependent xanthine dehydrogenase [Thermoanaerobaculia bacterium]
MVAFTLNGQTVRVDARRGETLLETLRNRAQVTSVKNGCAPQGQCGACLVLVDGNPKTSCATPTAAVEGHSITTVEGLPEEEQRMLARCFVAASGLQCGFCIPGVAIRVHALVRKNEQPSREQIARALDGHLCRCTGYAKIIDAIEMFARVRRGQPEPDLVESGGVGARMARVAAADTVLGNRPFIDDLRRENMLHGAVVLSPHARAHVVDIDTSRAKAIPGVAAVITAADVPGSRWYGLIEEDWPGFVAIGEETRYVGDVLAAVAADDEVTARRAAAMVDVTYEVLPAVLSPIDAMLPNAPRINPKHENILGRTKIVRGHADTALAASAHVVSGTWRTQRIEHLFLETESALAEPLGHRIRIYSGGQGIFDDRRQIASFLGVPTDDVFVEQVSAGGAFGGKEDLSIQAQTALLARITNRPVKLTLNREESIRLHPKRHPLTMEYEAGCDHNGQLTALWARIIGDSGAYASVGAKVLERAAGHACGAYHIPNVDIESLAVYTNNPPCGAMRGFGSNQTNFAMEGCIDLLAKKAGLDPWEMRWRNALDVGKTFTTGQVLEKSVGLKKTLIAVRRQYDDAKFAGKAVGIACGVKNSGLGNGAREFGRARLVVEPDETISIYNGYSEVGQGLLTILVQLAVETTALHASKFRPKIDTRYALDCGQTTGSRATMLGGRAVVDAARKLRADLDAGKQLTDLRGREYEGEVVIDDTTPVGALTDSPKTHTAFGFATQLCILDGDGGIERIVAAHDVGRAINPAFCEGQIEGAVHMGLGYALTEELPCPDGMPATFKLMELGVLRATDTPPVDVILIEDPEPEGPFGAKGLGEIGLVPTAAAVAGALEAFDGIRRTTLPMKDSAAAHSMRVGRIRTHTTHLTTTVNAHTHLYSGLAPLGMPRPKRPPQNFIEILKSIWWKLDRALDEDSLRAAARLYVAEALLAGTTMIVDHHESPNFISGSLDVLADACHDLGVRALLCYGATERNSGRDEALRGLAECERFIRSNERPLVQGAVGLHASFTVSDETILDAGDLCRSLGVRMHVHVAEDVADVEDARRRGYGSPLARLDLLRGLVPRSIIAHGVHLTEADLGIIEELRLWVVQNPRSNETNRVGKPHRLAGLPRVCLGTDGFPSDMREEAKARPEAGTTRDDGHALAADIAADSASDSVTLEDGRVHDVTIGGRAVVRGGELLTGDIEEIRTNAAHEAARLWKRMEGISE